MTPAQKEALSRAWREWQPVGPGEHRPSEEDAEVEYQLRRRQEEVRRGTDRSGVPQEELANDGIVRQRCGGGHRILRKRIGD